MSVFDVLLLAGLVIGTVCFEACPGNFCPPKWQRLKVVREELDYAGSVMLGKDEESGCMCREVPGKFSFCYGRATCRSFPKNFNITTNTLLVKATQIIELKIGDLSKLTDLETLKIEGNNNLSRISTGSFLEMSRLSNLSISYNANLRSLEVGSFDGLINLERLFLVKNAFVKLAELTLALAKIPRLQKLQLSENNFRRISRFDFEPMRDCALNELNLILCQIEQIAPQAFNPLTNLTVLRLGENSFDASTITRVIEETIEHVPLRLLNLYLIGLRKSPPKPLLTAIGKSNITSLCLARNQFEVINADSFPQMPNLQILDLREVLLLNITNDAFVGLSNLKTLLLSGNKLSSIPEGALLERLTYLDLQHNSGNSFASTYFSIFGQKFTKMKNLELLDLSFNAIHAVYNSSFLGLVNLRILGLKNATIFYIANGSFAMLPKLVFLNLENNHFAKNHSMGLRFELFEGLGNLRVLLLGGCGISFINKHPNPFRELKNLRHLGLERNKLITIQGFEVLINLRTLDLSQNGLQPWYGRIFHKNYQLKDVRLGNNRFSFLTETMIKDFENLINLELRNNPFTCDCSFSWNTGTIMRLIENQTIFCAFPESTTRLTIQEFLQQEHCQNLALVLPLVFLFIFIAVLIFLLYYFRWHLRYWLFLTRLYLSRNGKIRIHKERSAYTNYIYDAFVSYSSEDRNFVIRLVTMLENYPPFIKLCVYERDFEVGTTISENVLESLAKSRKTLLIISNSYAKSQWCKWESQLAEHHRLFFRNENGEYIDDSLILIKLGPVNEAHLTPTLKYLLKTRIYLHWDVEEKKQKVFWEKLRTTLAPPQEINENTYL
ncbi:TIR and/or LRR 8 domain containing protein [Asbolus verrucosus]|uniref:TIR and/or LRR 8 domain containing protein n=1 Tax=Asbolus verrucosus TaxID=1661398 RepID=A0A482W0E6_ASBVE|nr:TIR and/or LRR 8 domain containing protein [Asbolus verrucosus]